MVALFIYIYTLVASRSEFYTSILCEVIKTRKKPTSSYFSPDVVCRPLAVDEKICCAFSMVHIIFKYYMKDLSKAVVISLTQRKTYIDITREVEILFSQYYIRDICLSWVPIKHYFAEKLLSAFSYIVYAHILL